MWLVAFWLWLIPVGSGNADPFEDAKRQLAHADCARFEFISILYSDIFKLADSASGAACIARDGRYDLHLGADRYLYDNTHLYSYSAENNQVVVEPLPPQVAGREISFITRLDELYQTLVVRRGQVYRLLRRVSDEPPADEIPDSLVAYMTPDSTRLERLEYLDLNLERNVIVILSQSLDSLCNDSSFLPAFPDSVSRIKL